MKTEKNILIAFILNLAFSIFEFLGGIYTGSVAIISDAIHDVGDALSIGIAFFLEKTSKKQPDNSHTYGYGRYSVLGSVITTLILIFGSIIVIYNAMEKIISPSHINYNGMILFAIVGVCVNFCASVFTHGDGSLNQKAVNLHMLEDTLGWIIILIGAIIMRFTDFKLIDPIMSIAVALFIFINAIKNLKTAIDLFLEKTPSDIDIKKIKREICEISGILDAHHIHVWSIDGHNNFATIHVVTNEDAHHIKDIIRHKMHHFNINHVTIELEKEGEHCHHQNCIIEHNNSHAHCHHHH